MSDKLNIEQLFQKTFKDHEVTPSDQSWVKLQRSLKRKQFMRFNPRKLNIFYVAGVIIIGGIIAVASFSNSVQVDNANELTDSPATTNAQNLESPAGSDKSDAADDIAVLRTEKSKEYSPNENREQEISIIEDEKLINSADGSEEALNEKGNNETEDILKSSEQKISTLVVYFRPSVYEGCAPLKVSFLNSTQNAKELSWKFGNNQSSAENYPEVSTVYNEPGTYTVTLTATDEQGLAQSHSEIISVHPLPLAAFEIDDFRTDSEKIHVLNYSKNASTYNWKMLPSAEREVLKRLQSFSTEFQPVIDQQSLINNNSSKLMLISENEYGCSDTAITDLPEIKLPQLIFPTAFSPNPNGSIGGYYNANEPNNQVFHPKYNEEPATYLLQVFNKSGELIFSSRELEIGWDGYYREAAAKQGVYIYQCTGTWKNGDPFNYRGDITILWKEN